MNSPRGVATNLLTGNVVVTDYLNARIDEFTPWGEFVKAWGFGVDTGAVELEECTAETTCQSGLAGDGPGQLRVPTGIAVDPAGSVYVYDIESSRVTKYTEEGDFVLTFGGNVNKTTGAEVCTEASGDECGAGEVGSAPGFFANGTVGVFITIGPAGTIFVGDKDRIQEFNLDGTFKAEIPFTGELATLAGKSVYGLAADPVSGDLFVSFNDTGDLYRISATGELRGKVEDTVSIGSEEKTFPVNPAGLTVDSDGNLYVIDHASTSGPQGGPFEILKFSPAGECLICGTKLAQPSAQTGLGPQLLGLSTSDACGIEGHDLYVTVFYGFSPLISALQSYGPPPQDVQNCPPPKSPPDIADQFAVSVGDDDAAVQARINPRFWNDTRYYVQYGPQECFDSGWATGCLTQPAPPGDILTDKVLIRSVLTDEVPLDGLQPNTTYYFRFVAESSGGGPVFGGGSSFKTFPATLAPKTDCPNQVFRTGPSALLPDCRAFEMVSPVDKNGGDIATGQSIRNYPAALDLLSADGNTATFSSSTSFADSVSSSYTSQYIARRDPAAGWRTEAISPPRPEPILEAGAVGELDLQYKLFSPDLGQAWLMQEADPPLDDCGVEGFINWYKRDNATGAYEAITTKPPPSQGPLEYFSEVQGASADGIRTIFRANDKLATDEGVEAANIAGYQLYEHVADPTGQTCGKTRLVSVLPNETASATNSSAGTGATGTSGATFIESRENLVHNAVSEDGSIVYWTATGEGPGKIYVRINGSETAPVSGASPARFWTASDDGTFAYYTEGETLKLFSFDTGNAIIATQVIGLVGASEDASRAYFVSRSDLDAGGEATAGQPNLYLIEEGATTYVATLSATDVSPNTHQTPIDVFPVAHTSSLSEDGRFLAFTSDAPLTGHNNIDTQSELPDTEAFFYEADSGELRCISCPSTGSAPTGRVLPGANNTQQGYAAEIPPWKNQFHAPRVISADGSTVYFESLERLVTRDINGMQDVYQWQRATDEAACEELGAEILNPLAGGCISLISSGTGDDNAAFVDSTADGGDVFFKTSTSLVSQDPGGIDLYDARVGGGFPPPPVPDPPCEGKDPCPPPPIPPPVTNPATGGSGNPDLAPCERLQRKAGKFAAKARKLRAKAGKADGAQAKKLRAKAKKTSKKAKRLNAQAEKCFTGARGK